MKLYVYTDKNAKAVIFMTYASGILEADEKINLALNVKINKMNWVGCMIIDSDMVWKVVLSKLDKGDALTPNEQYELKWALTYDEKIIAMYHEMGLNKAKAVADHIDKWSGGKLEF